MIQKTLHFILFVGLSCSVLEIQSECCFGSNGWNPLHAVFEDLRGTCADGTRATPCCGYTDCGLDCCQCAENSCRGVADERVEGRIILPKAKNDGSSLADVKSALETKLHDAFGGYTVIDGNGSWRNKEGVTFTEPSWVFDIAIKRSDLHLLQDIAVWLRGEAQQEAIFLRKNGKIEFI